MVEAGSVEKEETKIPEDSERLMGTIKTMSGVMAIGAVKMDRFGIKTTIHQKMKANWAQELNKGTLEIGASLVSTRKAKAGAVRSNKMRILSGWIPLRS